MTYPSWLTQTNIVHLMGDSPDGPFQKIDAVVPVAAGNPTITVSPQDGEYLLYFTNYRYNGPVANCTTDALSNEAIESRHHEKNNSACGIHLAHSRSLDGPWNIVYDIALGLGTQHWDNCSLTNPGPWVYPNGTVLMMFKLCRYPPNCPHSRYISGLLTSPLPPAPGVPAYLQQYTRRPRTTPIFNSTVSVEDPSNGFIDSRGTLHMIAHVGSAKGGALHSQNGIDWAQDLSGQVYPDSINYNDGTTLQLSCRQEPKLLLNQTTGLPTHLINVCCTGGIAHTFVCLQPICTSSNC